MNTKSFNKINQVSGNKITLEKTKVIIKPYGDNNTPLEVVGKFDTFIESNNKIVKMYYFAVKTEKINLFSGTPALILKLIEFNSCEKVNNCDFDWKTSMFHYVYKILLNHVMALFLQKQLVKLRIIKLNFMSTPA